MPSQNHILSYPSASSAFPANGELYSPFPHNLCICGNSPANQLTGNCIPRFLIICASVAIPSWDEVPPRPIYPKRLSCLPKIISYLTHQRHQRSRLTGNCIPRFLIICASVAILLPVTTRFHLGPSILKGSLAFPKSYLILPISVISVPG